MGISEGVPLDDAPSSGPDRVERVSLGLSFSMELNAEEIVLPPDKPDSDPSKRTVGTPFSEDGNPELGVVVAVVVVAGVCTRAKLMVPIPDRPAG
mgnify:CR=1 FL=1